MTGDIRALDWMIVIAYLIAIFLANGDVASAYETFQRYLGILTAGLACLFLMGRFMPRVNGFGAVCGLAANYLVTFGLDLVPWSAKPHLLLYGLCGMAVCLVVALVMSICKVSQKYVNKEKENC